MPESRSSQPSPTGPNGPVIAGIGAVTGHGWGEKRVRDGLYSARSAVAAVPGPSSSPSRQPRWMAVVSDEGDPADGSDRLARASRFAAREAFADAWERGWRPAGSMGVVHAVAEPTATAGTAVVPEVAHELALGGPTMTVTGGPTAGLAALVTAATWIGGGLADDVLVVASDLSASIEWSSGAGTGPGLHTEAPARVVCRPFQEGSIGPNPGEASVAMVLSARSPGAYGQLAGWSLTQSTAMRAGVPDRTLLSQTVLSALTVADVDPEHVAYVNAHGSGVPESDAVESEVLDGLLDAASGVYSLKPLVGDCRSASGLVELLAALYGFTTGVIPAPPRMAKGHARLLDGPTAGTDGPVVKTSLGPAGEIAVVVVRPVS